MEYSPDGIDLQFMSINNVDLFEDVVQVPDLNGTIDGWSNDLENTKTLSKVNMIFVEFNYRVPGTDGVRNDS